MQVADEGDWIELLVASERVSQWLDVLRWGTPKQKRQAAENFYIEIKSKETYVEEAKAAGAIHLLTKIISKSDDEELVATAISIVAICSGPGAGGKRIQEVRHGEHIICVQEGALGDGLGARIWVAAHCLCKFMERGPELIRGHNVLEIGSGCGLCGLLAAKLGAKQVTLTDYEPSVLLNLRANTALNSNPCMDPSSDTGWQSSDTWQEGMIRICCLDWIEALPENARIEVMKEDSIAGRASETQGPPSLPDSERFDVIIGSDLIYELYHADMVAAVLARHLTKQGRAYIALAIRRQAHLDRLLQQTKHSGLHVSVQQQEIDAEAVGIVGREHEYEGGFVLLTISFPHC